jgi:hypothetical protein
VNVPDPLGVSKVSSPQERPQPKDLDTGERMATTLRAVAQGIAHEARCFGASCAPRLSPWLTAL